MRIAVIGCGPRGLGILERLISRARSCNSVIQVHVVEPGTPGPGMHTTDQPDYMLLNTVCGELTAFPDSGMLGQETTRVTGPSLFEWCQDHGLQLADNGYQVVPDGQGNRPIQPVDHLPRRVLGEYLAWAAAQIIAAAPANVTVTHEREPAVTVTGRDGTRVVTLESGKTIRADHVVVTVGHGDPPSGPVDAAYPLPDAVSTIPPEATVAVQGAGLTAMDVLAALTVGRGGTFTQDHDGEPRYEPSGAEPQIVLTTRNGRPALARPRANSGREPLPPQHLTVAALDQLRERKLHHQLDFQTDVVPLVLNEMRYRWRATGGVGDPPDFEELLLGAVPSKVLASHAAYTRWYTSQLRSDLGEADIGLGNSPFKEAVEVLRDHRDVLRAAIDPPGLTEESRDWFFTTFAPAVNRLVIGPQRERHHELLALLASGTVTVGPGPDPSLHEQGTATTLESTALADPLAVSVDMVMPAYSGRPRLVESANPLLNALAVTGKISKVADAAPLGARVDRQHRAIGRTDESDEAVSILGPITEGSSYYNHYVASPANPSRAIQDADAVATRLLTHQPSPHERPIPTIA